MQADLSSFYVQVFPGRPWEAGASLGFLDPDELSPVPSANLKLIVPFAPRWVTASEKEWREIGGDFDQGALRTGTNYRILYAKIGEQIRVPLTGGGWSIKLHPEWIMTVTARFEPLDGDDLAKRQEHPGVPYGMGKPLTAWPGGLPAELPTDMQ